MAKAARLGRFHYQRMVSQPSRHEVASDSHMAANHYTHGHHESVLRSHRWRTAENSAAYLLPNLQPGMTLLDVGCGPGTITVDLAAVVAPGHVLGIDASADVIAQATTEAANRGVEVSFQVGDAYALDLPDGSVDVVHAHQVLQHLNDPVAALVEWRRVTKPGGIVAARDADYGAFTWFPADPRLDRWCDLYRAQARANDAEPDAGRRMLSWALAAGFERDQIAATGSVWCYTTPEERAWWGGLWADRVTISDLARQLAESGRSTTEELATLADAWRQWAAADDGWFIVPNGEIICRVGA